MLGDFVDVDITVPNHSIFYALTAYTGNSQVIRRTLQCIKMRLGKVSLTLKENIIHEEG